MTLTKLHFSNFVTVGQRFGCSFCETVWGFLDSQISGWVVLWLYQGGDRKAVNWKWCKKNSYDSEWVIINHFTNRTDTEWVYIMGCGQRGLETHPWLQYALWMSLCSWGMAVYLFLCAGIMLYNCWVCWQHEHILGVTLIGTCMTGLLSDCRWNCISIVSDIK